MSVISQHSSLVSLRRPAGGRACRSRISYTHIPPGLAPSLLKALVSMNVFPVSIEFCQVHHEWGGGSWEIKWGRRLVVHPEEVWFKMPKLWQLMTCGKIRQTPGVLPVPRKQGGASLRRWRGIERRSQGPDPHRPTDLTVMRPGVKVIGFKGLYFLQIAGFITEMTTKFPKSYLLKTGMGFRATCPAVQQVSQSTTTCLSFASLWRPLQEWWFQGSWEETIPGQRGRPSSCVSKYHCSSKHRWNQQRWDGGLLWYRSQTLSLWQQRQDVVVENGQRGRIWYWIAQ